MIGDALYQFTEQFRLTAVALVERQLIKAESVADGAVIHLQDDLPLGPISYSVGNPGYLAVVAIHISAFRGGTTRR